MGGKVGFCGMKKAPIRQVGAYERLSAAGGFRSLALILSAHSAGIRIVTYGPERECFLCLGRNPGRAPGFKRGIPLAAASGQPARLDRAGPQARTRLSPAGGMGAVVWAKKISSPGSTPQVN